MFDKVTLDYNSELFQSMFDVGIPLQMVNNRVQNGVNSKIPLLVHYNGGAKAADGRQESPGGIADTNFHRPNVVKKYREREEWGNKPISQAEFKKYVTFFDSFDLTEVAVDYQAICPTDWMQNENN